MKKVFAIAMFLLSFGAFNAQAQDYTNNKNPFDNYGTIHNEILSDFVAKKLKSGLPMETVISEGRKIIEGNSRYLSAVGEGSLNFESSLVDKAYKDFPNNYRNLVASTKLSAPTQAIIQKIMDKTFEAGTIYGDFITFVKTEESKILAADISQSEKNLLLQCTSVARHSAYLWKVKYSLDGTSTTTGKSKARGWGIVGCDLLGGIIGGLAGAAYGSMCGYYGSAGF